MANTGGTAAPAGRAPAIQRYLNRGTGRMETAQQMRGGRASGKPAVNQTAQNRSSQQRYLNKASNRMETAEQIHNYHAPQPQHAPAHAPVHQAPAHAPVQAPAQAPQQPSLIQMTPAQIEARAAAIVDSEIQAERLPFQQRASRIPGEEAAQQAGHAAAYSQLDTQIKNEQGAQQASAKTFENEAADRLKKAEAPAPVNEHPGASLTPQQQASMEQSRTLLQSIAQAGAAGTTARQQASEASLNSLRAEEAAQGTAGSGVIRGEYGKRAGENASQEAQILAGKAGRTGKLALNLFGEQEKDRLSAEGLGIKESAQKTNELKANTTATNDREQRAGERAKIGQGNRKLKIDESKAASDRAYREATLGTKNKAEALGIREKELKIRKLLESGSGNGEPLTKLQLAKFSSEFGAAFATFQRGRAAGATPQQIREGLEVGSHHVSASPQEVKKGEKQLAAKEISKKEFERLKAGKSQKLPTVKNHVFLQAAEDLMQKEYLSTQTKAEFRQLGLKDSGWSNALIHHTPAARAPNIGNRRNG